MGWLGGAWLRPQVQPSELLPSALVRAASSIYLPGVSEATKSAESPGKYHHTAGSVVPSMTGSERVCIYLSELS